MVADSRMKTGCHQNMEPPFPFLFLSLSLALLLTIVSMIATAFERENGLVLLGKTSCVIGAIRGARCVLNSSQWPRNGWRTKCHFVVSRTKGRRRKERVGVGGVVGLKTVLRLNCEVGGRTWSWSWMMKTVPEERLDDSDGREEDDGEWVWGQDE